VRGRGIRIREKEEENEEREDKWDTCPIMSGREKMV
jgi:hypothetical protein